LSQNENDQRAEAIRHKPKVSGVQTMKRIALVAVLSAMAIPALAADLPRRQGGQSFQPSTLPAFTWTGFYVGLNGGAGWGKFTRDARGIDGRTGFVGGATLGYNQQIGNFVAGLEGDYNYSGIEGRAFGLVKGGLSSFGTVRGRLGFAFDRALVYGTGGYAFGFGNVEVLGLKDNRTHQGYVVGGGVEYAFTQNISAKAEYLYMPLGKQNYFSAFGAPIQAGLNTSVVRAGVNYRF
jgi:outer membrane immunogenic protein